MTGQELYKLGEDLYKSQKKKEKQKGIEYFEQAAAQNYPAALDKMITVYADNIPKLLQYLKKAEETDVLESISLSTAFKALYIHIQKNPTDDATLNDTLRIGEKAKREEAKYYLGKILLLNTKYRNVEKAKNAFEQAYFKVKEFTDEEQALVGRQNSLDSRFKTARTKNELLNCVKARYNFDTFLSNVPIQVVAECRSEAVCQELLKIKLAKKGGIFKKIAKGELKPKSVILEYHPIYLLGMEVDDFSITWKRIRGDETTHTGSADLVDQSSRANAESAFPQVKFFDMNHRAVFRNAIFEDIPDGLNYVIGESYFTDKISKEYDEVKKALDSNMRLSGERFVASKYGWSSGTIEARIQGVPDTRKDKEVVFYPVYVFEYESGKERKLIRVSGISDDICIKDWKLTEEAVRTEKAEKEKSKMSLRSYIVLAIFLPPIGIPIGLLALLGWLIKKKR